MLVLARQLNERIIMPTVETTIEVVAIKPGGVRLGIEAPPEVTILREEVYRRGQSASSMLTPPAEQDAETRLARIKHVVRNRLNTVALGLNLLRQQLRNNPAPGLETMLERMEEEVRTLDQQLKALLVDPLDDLAAPRVVRASRFESSEGGLSI